MPGAPDLRFPSIDGLRAFEAAVRLGSFERAAEELTITASAVSKRVATLEDLLATPLLQRAGKALVLTAAGKEYLGQVRSVMAQLAAMPLHQRSTQRRQRLRITTPPTFARQILVPRLGSFTAAHPEIELELLLSVPYTEVASPESDIEVRATEPGQGTVLLTDQVLPVAAPALIRQLPPVREAADLAHAPLLRTPLEPWAPWFRAAGLDWPEPATGMKLVDLGLTLEAAASGQGVALARPSLARAWLDNGSLRPLLTQSSTAAYPYVLMPHAGTGPALLFARWLQAACAQAQAESLHWLSGLT
jgi:DNA-binding transcriptional LysR family regulator